MSLRTCADCSTQYSLDLAACPHCGSSDFVTEEGAVAKRFPLSLSLSCPQCGRGPWTYRLNSVTSGLIELPTLACAACGSRVPVTWPPEEEPMSPKITVHGGATNAHGEDDSPVDDVSQPQVGAEADLGRPTSDEPVKVVERDDEKDGTPELEPEPEQQDYNAMTLGELRDTATARNIASYGTKAQIVERLREADASEDSAE